MATKKEVIKRYYKGIEVDSDEEIMCLQWLFELQEYGYVYKVERADTFVLSEGCTNRYDETIQMKTKTKEVEKKQILMNAHEYTPEFKVIWDSRKYPNPFLTLQRGVKKIVEPFLGTLEDLQDDIVTYMEVKPSWDQNNMTRLFKINQKWMWEKYGIFINLIHPHILFEKTFTPKEYLLTTTGKQRKINWKIVTIDEYLDKMNAL